jgi:hypothetical protein
MLVAAMGVEPITLTYEASMIPFHYAARWQRDQGLNLANPVLETRYRTSGPDKTYISELFIILPSGI